MSGIYAGGLYPVLWGRVRRTVSQDDRIYVDTGPSGSWEKLPGQPGVQVEEIAAAGGEKIINGSIGLMDTFTSVGRSLIVI